MILVFKMAHEKDFSNPYARFGLHDFYLLKVNCFSKSSNETCFVSGIMRQTQTSWSTIIKAKIANTVAAPILVNSTGTSDGMAAASTQWTELPNACPLARK